MDTLSKSGAAVSTIPLRTICWRLNISPTYLLDPFVKVTLQQVLLSSYKNLPTHS